MGLASRACALVALAVVTTGCGGKSDARANSRNEGSSGTSGTGANSGGSSGGSGDAGMGGTSGTTATGGQAGATGGAPPNGGTAGTAGTAGSSAGDGGTNGDCTFTIDGSLSSAIPTVGIVEWSTDLAGLTEARVEFTLNGAAADVINEGGGGPVSVEGTPHRALLLGLKPERTYTYRIVAKSGSTECTSMDRTLTTGARPNANRSVMRMARDPSAQAHGFVITICRFIDIADKACIIDADGDEVWWAPVPALTNRALMSWDGTDLWMLASNAGAMGAELRRVSMDGLEMETVAGIPTLHHDFAVLPGGVVAGLAWTNVGMAGAYYSPSDLVERSADGTLRTVIRLYDNVYPSEGMMYQATSIAYQASDDTYTVGDSILGAFVKISRNGELLWQFGGNCGDSRAPKCASGAFQERLGGHHLLPNGHLVLIDNPLGTANESSVFEYALTETPSSLSAEELMHYSPRDTSSQNYVDVQRLPNGNTLIAYSEAGEIREITPDETIVQNLWAQEFGYVSFRETLYGPPIR